MGLQKLKRVVCACALTTGVFVFAGEVPRAAASTITVNTALDIAPSIDVNGNTNYPNDGLCSLRAAIFVVASNTNAADVNCQPPSPIANVLDIIAISPALAGQTMTMTYTREGLVQPFENIYGTENPVEIIGPTLNAADFTISGADAVRPFVLGFLTTPAEVTMANLTVSHGNGKNNKAGLPAIDNLGGAFYLGDGVHLTLDNVVVRDNNVSGANPRGGAIYGTGPIITNNGGAYINNRAAGTGGVQDGGAIYMDQASCDGCGSGTFNGYAALFQGNSAAGKGGAFAANAGTGTGKIYLERSLIRDNVAGRGGVTSMQPAIAGTPAYTAFELHDSTVTGNSEVFFAQSTLQGFRFERDTFVNTGAMINGAGHGVLINSIVTGGTSCLYGAEVAPGFTSSRNLISFFEFQNCEARFEDLGDVTNLSPTLAQNGGPEVQQTFALLGGSNAIDNGSNTFCGTIDARSVARGFDGDGIVNSPRFGDCDIGAYEYVKYVVNFVTGSSAVPENIGGSSGVGVKLKILDPTEPALTAALTFSVTVDPVASTAASGPNGDFSVTGNSVTFPVGSRSGDVVNLPVQIRNDNVDELFGEQIFFGLGAVAGVGTAEPRTHTLSIADDDHAGVVVDDGGSVAVVSEATPLVSDTIVVKLGSEPDRALLNPARPGDPASYGPPADVTVHATPDRDCTIKDSSGNTGSFGNPLNTTILNANWQTGKTLQIFVVQDDYDEDFRNEADVHHCQIRFTFSSADPIYNVAQSAYDVNVTDNDVANVNVEQVGGPAVLTEGGTDTNVYAVNLASSPDPGKPLPNTPRADTQVLFTPSSGCEVGLGQTPATFAATPASLPFNQTNRSGLKYFAVRPTDNLSVELIHGCTVTTSIVSPDPVYGDVGQPGYLGFPATVSATVEDYDPPTITNDPPRVLITTTGGITQVSEEIASIDFLRVVLHRAPVGQNVSVTLSAATDTLIAGPQLAVQSGAGAPGPSVTLTFTPLNWSVPQTVNVRAVDDDYDEADTHQWQVTGSISSTAVGFDDATLRHFYIDGVAQPGDGATLSVDIADDDTSDVVEVVTGRDTTVFEGDASDTFSVLLVTHPYADVHIDVTTDAECTVDAGSFDIVADSWNTPAPVTVSAVDDDLKELNSHPCAVTVVASSTDVLYNGLSEDVPVNVIDDEKADILISTSDGDGVDVAEGGASESFSLVLASRPSADVTVDFADDAQTTSPPSVTFTPSNWSTAQTVMVTAVDDDIDEGVVYNGSIALSVTTTALGYATGSMFYVDGVPAATAVGTLITDDDTAGVAQSSSTLTVEEDGGADTYTVELMSEPTATVTIALSATGLCSVGPASLVFEASDWDTPQTVTVTPGDNDAVVPMTCSIGHVVTSADGYYSVLTPPAVTGALTEDDVAGVEVAGSGLAVDEAAVATTASYTVALTSEPLQDVTITPAAPDGQTTVGPASLTYTAANWSTPQMVTVSVVDDPDAETSPHTGTITHTSASADLSYGAAVPFTVNGSAGSDVAVAITDNDNPDIVEVATGSDTTVTEDGASDSVLVLLTTRPTGSVRVTVSADAQCTVDTGAFDIATSAWNTPVTVNVSAVDDDLKEMDTHSCTLTIGTTSADAHYNGLGDSVTVDVVDNEEAVVLISTSDGNGVDVAEGGSSESFSVVLLSKPSADVTVDFADDAQTSSPSSVTFTTANWDSAQTVLVTAVDDDLDEAAVHNGAITLSVTTTALGYASATLFSVDGNLASAVGTFISDDDSAGVSQSSSTLTLVEDGADETYTIELTSEPTATVTIALTATGLCSVGPVSLVFHASDWDTAQTVTVTPGDDDAVLPTSCSTSHAVTSADGNYSVLTPPDVAGALIENDVAGVVLDGVGLSLNEATSGTTVTYTVVLRTLPPQDVTITPATPDGQTTVAPATLTFTPANWNKPQTVTVTVVDDLAAEASPHSGSITHVAASTDPSYGPGVPFVVNGTPGSAITIAITDDETQTAVVISGGQPSTAVSVPATATVTGGVVPATGTVQFSVDGAPIGAPVALVNGVAEGNLGLQAHGGHTVLAEYSGDARHDPSSGASTFTVLAPPVAVDDAATVDEDGSVVVAAIGNDTDADLDSLSVEVGSFTQGVHGSVTCSTTTCTYTPSANFHGTDTFIYVATDGSLTDTGAVTVTVNAVNDPPVLKSVALTVASDGSVTFELLADVTDADGDTLTVSVVTQPAHGSVSCTPGGHCTYTPTAGYVGEDSFTYVVSDGTTGSVATLRAVDSPASVHGTVTITVTQGTTSVGGTGGDEPTGDPTGGDGAGGDGTGGSGVGGTGVGGPTGPMAVELPATGFNVLAILQLGLALLAVGLVAVRGRRLVRRR